MPIGVVPWTLRHQVFTVEQVKNTYEKLHALGFDGIESGLGTGVGLSAAEDLALLKEYSLTPCSVYTDIKDPEKAVELTPEQQATVRQYMQEKLRIRKELREVQYQLNADIDALGRTLKLVNIALVPSLLTVGVLLGWLWRRRRMARGGH